MHKFYIFILTGLFLNLASAQITITSSAMPSAGDTLRYSTVSPLGLDLGLSQTGASQTWDYSGLQSNGQDIYQYYSSLKTPYFFYFFNQIGLKTADSIGVSTFSFKNIYSFYTKNSSVFKAEGVGYSVAGIPLASNYTDDDEIYQFPLNYNDSDVSTFRFVFSIPGQTSISFVQAGKRTNVVDGWGSIKTPYKTYSDVLRVRTLVDEVDTLVTQFGKFPVPRKQLIYKWLSANERIPVLEISGTLAGSIFTPTQIRYRDMYTGKANPLTPRARFSVDKTSGFANADTFSFTDLTTPFAFTYQWQFQPSGKVKFTGGTSASSRNPKVVFTDKGLYSVTLVATNTAGSDDTTAIDLINIDFNAGVQRTTKGQVSVYPNPSAGVIHLGAMNAKCEVRIFDTQFRQVFQGLTDEEGVLSITTPLRDGIFWIECNGNVRQLILGGSAGAR